MSNINCNACETLKNTSPHFVANGITSTECTSLAADTGLNPNLTNKHNDATDLHTMNDCLVGRQAGELEDYNVCDWQDFMAKFIANLYEMLKGIICALGGVWTHIHNLLTRVAGLETRMTNVEGRVTTLESDVSGLKTRVTNLEGDVSGLKTRVSSLEDDMDDLKDDVSDLKTDVNGLKTDVNGLKTDVNGLKGRMTTAEGKITNLESDVNGIKTDVNGLKGRMTTAEGKITNLESTVSGHGTRITNLENNYTSLSNTVAGHTTTINNLTTTVNNYSSSISQNTADISALTTKLNNLIAALGGSTNVVPVIKRYRVTVPVGAFGQVWRVTSGVQQNADPSPDDPDNWYSVSDVTEWFAGSGNNAELGEFRIIIPVSEMESITGVWTQTQVVPSGNPYDGRGKGYIQTVNVQGWEQEGTNLIVNFDTYELAPASTLGQQDGHNGGPYPVTVDFLVVGTKTISPI